MSKVLAIAQKDLKLRSGSKTQLLFFIILPLIFTLLLSGVFFGSGSSKITMVVVDEDNSDLSHSLVNQLMASQVVAPSIMTREEALKAFTNGDTAAVLIIQSGMEAELKAGRPVTLDFKVDPTNSNGMAVQQEVKKTIGQIGGSLAAARLSTLAADNIQPFTNTALRQAYFDSSLSSAQQAFGSAPARIIVVQPANSLVLQNQKQTQAAQASAGELIIWVFIPLLATSEVLAYERTWGTLRRMVTSPTGKPTFLLGMLTGQFTYGLVQMILLVIIGVIILKVPWGQNPLALLILLVSFGLAGVAMGTMLGTFTRTPSQAQGISIALGMVMGLLGGCMLPLEMFPPAVANAAKILPTTWAMMGMTQLTIYNAGVVEILPYAAVLVGFAVLFFVIGILRFRYE